MKPLYQITDSDRPCIQVRQAESHDLAEHLLQHPFWRGSVRTALSSPDATDGDPPPRDGIEESADRVYLPRGIPPRLLVGLQSIVDGWVSTKAVK
jgi:hypothetical protein